MATWQSPIGRNTRVRIVMCELRIRVVPAPLRLAFLLTSPITIDDRVISHTDQLVDDRGWRLTVLQMRPHCRYRHAGQHELSPAYFVRSCMAKGIAREFFDSRSGLPRVVGDPVP
jgi:hypothetical protein